MKAKDIKVGEVYEVEPYKYEVAAMRVERVERDKQRWDGWRYIPNREGEGTLRAYGVLLDMETLEPLLDSQQRYMEDGRGLTLKQVVKPWDAEEYRRAKDAQKAAQERQQRVWDDAKQLAERLREAGIVADVFGSAVRIHSPSFEALADWLTDVEILNVKDGDDEGSNGGARP